MNLCDKIEKQLYEMYGIDNLILIFFFVEVTIIRTYYRKMNKLRNIYTIERGARKIFITKWEINYFKIKIIPVIVHF